MNRFSVISKLGAASAAVLAAAMIVGSGTAALAQSGEVVYYGYKGAMIPATIKAFNKIYPNIKVSAITGQGSETLARIKINNYQRRRKIRRATSSTATPTR